MAWFKTWFNTPYYHILYKDRDHKEAEAFISKLSALLALKDDAKVIDLACGKGRHSIYLNQLGYDVLGLDLSEESIEHNRKFENDSLHFEVHDMRDEISANNIDAVFNLFTSFGYFEKAEEDEKVFLSVFNCLDNGGYFVLDFLNGNFVESHLIPETIIDKGGISFKINKRIENQHVIKYIRFNDQGQDFHFTERVKLHTPEEISELANKVGFTKVHVFGDYDLNEFNREKSPRCITIFKKG